MQETQLTTISSAVIDGESHTLDRGAIIYSHRGIASVRINFDHWDMQGESVLIMFPGDVIKWEMMDDDFSADYLLANPREAGNDRGTQRKVELFNRFMQLLEDEYRLGHEVNYYAQRMNISRKYLGLIVSDRTGVSPKRIIDDYNFSDQSALTRYFRHHAGLSPQQYRLRQ